MIKSLRGCQIEDAGYPPRPDDGGTNRLGPMSTTPICIGGGDVESFRYREVATREPGTNLPAQSS
jgi:hypothetical protein